MGNILKILKINLLSVIALPLLMLSTASKLLAKALEKFLIMLGTALVMLVVGILFEILKNPEGTQRDTFQIVLLVIGAVLLIAVIMYVLTLISSVCMIVIEFAIGLFNGIYEIVYTGYTALFEICQDDYELICYDASGVVMGLACLFYTILRVINRIIILFVSHALKIFILCSVLLVAGSLYQFHFAVNAELGIGLFAYLKLFSVYDILFAAALYLVCMAGIIVVLISLGIEWSEWGQEMDLATSDYGAFTEFISRSSENLSGNYISGKDKGREKNLERCQEYLDKLDEHVKGLNGFMQEVSALVENSSNQVLITNFGAYIAGIRELLEEVSQYEESIPKDVFEDWIPRIKNLDSLKKEILKQIQRYREERPNIAGTGFFAGCSTAEKLEKRYKALCKTYHPDGESGDEETFKQMKEEYEQLKRNFP